MGCNVGMQLGVTDGHDEGILDGDRVGTCEG